MPAIKVSMNVREVVVFTGLSDMGYLRGVCQACKAGGFTQDNHGFPATPANKRKTSWRMKVGLLVHRADCPLNPFLNKDGMLIA